MDMLSLVEALSALLERILGENHVGFGCLRKAATLACSSSRTCVITHAGLGLMGSDCTQGHPPSSKYHASEAF